MNNQIVVVVGADGRILNTDQDGVFRRSNKQNELVALLSYRSVDAVKVNFLRADDVKPNSQYMTLIGSQTFEGKEYKVYSYALLDYQLYATGPLVVSFDVFSGSVMATTGDFTIDVEASEDECGAEAPTDPNQFDEAIKTLMSADSKLDNRVTALENRAQMKVLVDFTVNSETGIGTKYYSDGTTATVQFPTGGGETPVIKTDFLNVLEFTADSWVAESGGGYSLAFGPEQTGYTDNEYFVGLEQAGSETYEAGTETTPSMRAGYYTSADTVFKGSDGSLYITANAPYAGRLITIGGVVFSGKIISGVSYDEATYVLTVSYIDGTSKTYQLPKPDIAARYNANFTADEWIGSAAPWSITITAQMHGKGATPFCQTFNTAGEQVEFGVQRVSNGDITLYTNQKIAFTITIM